MLSQQHPATSSSRSWPGLVLFIIAIGGLIFITSQSLGELILAVQSRNWPTTQGQIIWLDIRTVSDKTGTTYFPRIIYQYIVDGSAYKNDRVRFSYDGVRSRSEAEKALSSYTVDKPIVVYYKLGNPQLACLETGGPYMSMIGSLLFEMVAISGGAWLIHHFLKAR